jgi:hypothetical protein
MAIKITGANASTDQAGTGVASGLYAHAEGFNTKATYQYAHASGRNSVSSGYCSYAQGDAATANTDAAHAEGSGTTASGIASHAEGSSCVASGTNSHAQGAYAVASRRGQHAQGMVYFSAAGDAQANTFMTGALTTDATPLPLYFYSTDTSATLTGANTNVLTIPVNRAHQFRIGVVARRSDVSGDAAGWTFTGLIARGSSGNSAAFVGTTQVQTWGTSSAAAWDVTVSIDTTDATNNYLKIVATGEAAKTIRWVARIETVEVG